MRDLAQLYKLGRAIEKARRLGPIEELRQAKPLLHPEKVI
jgi:hypothetical protein